MLLVTVFYSNAAFFVCSEPIYEKKKKGSYILFFRHDSKKLAIDATKETDTFGRLINHSRDANVSMKVVVVDKVPMIVFVALTEIQVGHEIQYDYGERRKLSLTRIHGYLSEMFFSWTS